MQKLEQATIPFGGPIEIGYLHEDGSWEPVQVKDKNLILYGSADALAKVISGDKTYAISTVYFEFTNDTVAPTVTNTDRAVNVSYYTGLSGLQDYIRSVIDLSPSFSTSDNTKYSNNVVTFFGVTSSSVGIKGNTFSQAAGSKVYGAALVISPTNDISGDKVFARFYFTTAQAKTNNSQIGVKWSVQFS